MKANEPATPTKGELEILQVLWRRGAATVREVHEEIGRANAYTTVLKLLQIMMGKGLVERAEAGRAHVYKARISEKQGTGQFIRDLVERVFGGSATRLVQQALGSGNTSKRELEEIRALLKQLEDKKP